MKIEYDHQKREATLDNRGLDFKDAALVFASSRRITWIDNRYEYGEARSIMVNVGNVLAGTKSGVYKTSDSGLNWTNSSNGIHAYGMAFPAIAVSGSYMFAGTNT
ncbi:MAG: BrnT family toxin, partial [Chlorobium sp.]|nr:BrnT family toxin [Chlorobium sp.]